MEYNIQQEFQKAMEEYNKANEAMQQAKGKLQYIQEIFILSQQSETQKLGDESEDSPPIVN